MKLSFYFDFLSPYSYLAWCWLRENRERFSVDWEFIPVTLANIIHAQDTKGPGEIEPKRNYLMRDLLRVTQVKNIPFQPPKPLPFNSLYALRLSLKECSGLESKDQQFQMIDHFFCAAWQEGKNIGDTEIVKDVLKKMSLPAEVWLEKVGTKELRKALKINTKEAISQGIFGLPTFLVHNEGEGAEPELFWGFDSTPYLTQYLQGEDPMDHEKLRNFQDCYSS